jgi:hypothetical protein
LCNRILRRDAAVNGPPFHYIENTPKFRRDGREKLPSFQRFPGEYGVPPWSIFNKPEGLLGFKLYYFLFLVCPHAGRARNFLLKAGLLDSEGECMTFSFGCPQSWAAVGE